MPAKVLIVDDDVQFCSQLVKELSQKDFQCFVLNTSDNVIETIKREGIHIVLLDIMLPQISGFELCRRIRTDREIYHIGIIFITAMKDHEELEHGFSQGADDYLIKPISMNMLLSRLNALLASIKRDPLVDDYTGFGTVRFMRLELQRTILLTQNFGFVYIELSGVQNLYNLLGEDESTRILRIFAKHLKSIVISYYGKDCILGHIGNGHFIIMIPPRDMDLFFKDLKNSWENSLGELFAKYRLSPDKFKHRSDIPLNLYICGLICNPTLTTSPQEVFNSLKQLYIKCKLQSSNRILIDKRNK
ncbi:MAG TPA: response regulator transcription factor [Candidatus Hydrogenedens sp.]|nr:response regulator transcription factor [Candidatus Hydrogenedens sp.]HOK08748.1 response regulator transcription factor [Candidatus Hydrogenedens sp.]HPP57556.1 response regulator transcription factor [Candidatus Hydrogenedens sp.]